MGGILFISSYNTGYGHRSITESLRGQIAALDASVRVDEVDAFMLGGKLTRMMSKMYNQVAVNAPLLWKICYSLGNIFPSAINFFSALTLKKAFIKLIRTTHPSLIVSVHPGYVSSVMDLLDKMGWKIPVVVMVADLDNVSHLWADRRSLYTLCPTETSKHSMLKLGIPEEKIKVFGFPVRDQFNHFNPPNELRLFNHLKNEGSLTFLIMNGSQGLRDVTKMAEALLKNFKCKVIILAGNNTKLKTSLEKALLPAFQGKVTICGFIENVEYYMSISDILILRASPNVLMEAVNLCKPVVVTGALTGQEEKNPAFVADHNLGAVCRDIRELPNVIRSLLSENEKRLHEIYEAQMKFRQPEAAKNTAAFLLKVLKYNQ